MELGGIGFWTVDMDDFKGFCHLSPYPLLRAGRRIFLQATNIPVSPTSDTLPPTTASVPPLTTTERRTAPPSRDVIAQDSPTTGGPNRDSEFADIPLLAQSLDVPSLDSNVRPTSSRKGMTLYRSDRDIIFQSFRIWIMNYFYTSTPGPT